MRLEYWKGDGQMPSDLEISRKLIGELLNELTLSVEDFRAKISAVLENALVSSRVAVQDSGVNTPDVSMKSGRRMRSSKTSPVSSAAPTMSIPVNAVPSDETSSRPMWTPPPWPEGQDNRPEWFARLVSGAWVTNQRSLCGRAGWVEYSETWPLSGTMRNGNVCLRPPLAPRTYAIAPSSSPIKEMWPTTNAYEERGERYTKETTEKHIAERRQVHLVQMVKHGLMPPTLYPTPTSSLGEATEGRGAETMNHDTVRRLREMGVLPTRQTEEVFPTPCASGAGTSPTTLQMVLDGISQMTLDRYVKLWPTPRAGDAGGQSLNATRDRILNGGDIMLSSLVKWGERGKLDDLIPRKD
jgi:hypothetical protein